MKNLKSTFKWMSLLSVLFMLCAVPAFAQEDCCGTCQDDKKAASCCGTCQDDKKAETCASKKAGTCASTCSKAAECPVASAKDPDFMAMVAKCGICKHVFEDMELLQAMDYHVSDWSQGLIFTVNLKKPEFMKKFRAYGKRDEKLTAQFKAMKAEDRNKGICPSCTQFFTYLDKGAKEERIQTPNGVVHLLTATDKALLKDMHAWAAKMRKDIESFDAQMTGSETAAGSPPPPPEKETKKTGCCGGCGGK